MGGTAHLHTLLKADIPYFFEFSIHDKTKEIIVKVMNADTGDLIREIPSEKILDIVAGIWKAVGLFVDEKR